MPPDPTDDDDRRDEPPVDGDSHDERPRDARDERNRSDGDRGGSGRDDASNGDLLSTLLSALESLDRISGSDRRRGNRGRLDYDISIRSGLRAIDSKPDGGSGRTDGPGSGNAPTSDRSRRRRRRRTSSSYRTETRTEAERLTVVADVAGADPDDVTVGYDGDDLVVAVDRSEIERVEIPWLDHTAQARVKNGVLTVTIERGGEDDE